MEYRNLSHEDAERFWALMDRLDHETEYMLYEPGERTRDLSQVRSVIRDSQRDDFLLAAETEHRLVGYASAQWAEPHRAYGGYRPRRQAGTGANPV